jgi:hypothetical protein
LIPSFPSLLSPLASPRSLNSDFSYSDY